MFSKLNKTYSLLVILAMYLIAGGIGFLTYWGLGKAFVIQDVLLQMLLADIAATIVIWLFSLLAKNSSVYDAYWSVAPLPMALGFIIARGTVWNAVDFIVLITLAIWAVRLTSNWARGWKGFKHEDWRYRRYRKQYPEIFHIINFFGIQLLPTLIVFFGTMPLYFVLNQTTSFIATTFAIVGMVICLAAVVIELFADEQMRKFKNNPDNKEKHIDTGLWKYSRHPNYFGEVTFWFGIFFMMISCFGEFALFDPHFMFFAIFAPVMMALMFVFVSIPMMEKHVLRKRPQYADYQKAVWMIVPLPRKQKKDDSENKQSKKIK
jgi:steroid 5-alpha reductase family enzyme